jgi:hypothetical protein
MLKTVRQLGRRRVVRWAATALASLGLSGCAEFWDEVTSHDFKFKNLYSNPNPLVVLKESTDGDARAKALRSLVEPKQHGGSDKEQDLIVTILVTAATSDAQPLCRLAAIHALGGFHDPRAVKGLSDAYYAVHAEPRSKTPGRWDKANGKGFSADTITIIECEALSALGRTKNPAAVETLAQVARPEPQIAVEVGEDKQEVMDTKLAAIRALANFNQYQGTEALLLVLQKEKDVAMRNSAVESLQVATGKKFGDDTKAWEDVLHSNGQGQPTGTANKPAKPPAKPADTQIKQVSAP